MSELAPERVAAAQGLAPELDRDDFEAVLGRIEEGVAVRMLDGRIVYANEAAARLLGLDSPSEVLRSPMGAHRQRFELFDEAGRPLAAEELPGERVRRGEPEAELLVRFRPVGGSEEQVALTRSVRTAGRDGEPRYIVTFFRTITEEAAAATLRKIERVTEAALSHFSVHDLLPALLDEIRAVLAADTAAILLLDDTGSWLKMRFTVGFAEEELSQAQRVPLGSGMAGRVAARREPWLIDDLDAIELASPVLRLHAIRSLIAIPLIVGDRVVGVAHVGSKVAEYFGQEDARVFALIGDRVALAVDHSAALEAERAAQARLTFLGEASAVLASSLNHDDTLKRVAQLAVPRLADWCAVDMLAEDGSIRRVAATRHPIDVNDDGRVAEVVRTGEPQLVRESMIVPVSARGRMLGAISFHWLDSERSYSRADLDFAMELARRAGIAVDNSQLYREAEEQAQAARVLAAVGDGVVLVDNSGIVRYWNHAAETITGVRHEDVVERPAVDAIAGWDVVVQRVPVAFGRGAVARALSLPLRLDDRELWLSVTGVAVVDGTVYAFRDQTEERALESMRSEFVSTVSHELRTPLAAIYGAAMTLQRDDVVLDAEQNATLLSVITNESDRLARTVNAILWTSRLDSDSLATTIENCDPRALASEIVDAQKTHLPVSVRLELHADPDLPAVRADPDKVRQVLVNLVDNAVKYSPDGGVVRLELGRDRNRVRFAVSDQGLGIPYAEQRRIFDKFYRLDPDLTRGIGGTGLGLYICRELVRRMDGRIWVVSEPGRGSMFAFELPAAV